MVTCDPDSRPDTPGRLAWPSSTSALSGLSPGGQYSLLHRACRTLNREILVPSPTPGPHGERQMLGGAHLTSAVGSADLAVSFRMAEYCVPASRMTSVAALTGSKYHLWHRYTRHSDLATRDMTLTQTRGLAARLCVCVIVLVTGFARTLAAADLRSSTTTRRSPEIQGFRKPHCVSKVCRCAHLLPRDTVSAH